MPVDSNGLCIEPTTEPTPVTPTSVGKETGTVSITQFNNETVTSNSDDQWYISKWKLTRSTDVTFSFFMFLYKKHTFDNWNICFYVFYFWNSQFATDRWCSLSTGIFLTCGCGGDLCSEEKTKQQTYKTKRYKNSSVTYKICGYC